MSPTVPEPSEISDRTSRFPSREEHAALSILLQAAGRRGDMQEPGRLHEEEIGRAPLDILARLTDVHRLHARLLHQIQSENPAWATTAFKAFLLRRQAELRQNLRNQARVLGELRAVLKKQAQPPLVFLLKGFSTHALLGTAQTLRFSQDMDLLASDPEVIYLALREIGFVGNRRTTHEFAKMRRGEMTVDLHQYFPVFAYPFPPARGAAELGGDDFTKTRISAADLHQDIVEVALEGEAITLLSLEAQALILCVHLFRDYTTRLHYLADRTHYVRLNDLADFQDLVRHPEFQPGHFQRLVTQFQAEDAVALVLFLEEHFLEVTLPQLGSDRCRKTFPEQLPLGGWVTACPGLERLVLVSAAWQLANCFPNARRIDAGEQCSDRATEGTTEVTTHSAPAGTVAWKMAFPAEPQNEQRILLHLCQERWLEWHLTPETGEITLIQAHGVNAQAISVQSVGRKIQITIALPQSENGTPNKAPLETLLLAVRCEGSKGVAGAAEHFILDCQPGATQVQLILGAFQVS